MFNVGGAEVLVILLVALLVLGPDKLPGAARTAAKVFRQLRDVSDGFQRELRQAINDDAPSGRGDVHPGAGAGPSLPAGAGTGSTTAVNDWARRGSTSAGAASAAPDEPGDGADAAGGDGADQTSTTTTTTTVAGRSASPADDGPTTWRTDGPSSSFS